jgi:hypothetical protein
MLIEIKNEILDAFLEHYSFEAVFLDKNNNEVKRLVVREFLPILNLDSFTTPTFKGRSRRLVFRKRIMSERIEKLGVLSVAYDFITEKEY